MSAVHKKRDKNNKPIVVIESGERSYNDKTVLKDINLSISPKEMVGVVGPNGGGKSTLLLLMAGLIRPTKGHVSICGIEAHALSLTAAGLVGLVTARPGLYPLLTGRENLQHFGGLFGLSSETVNEKTNPLVEMLDLTNNLDVRVDQLSTGMRQKLSLIRALMLSPKLLLLDEPTANLDPVASSALVSEVRKRANDGLACVLVTHDLAAAEAVCDRVLILDGVIKKTIRFKAQHSAPNGPLLLAWKKALGER